MCKDTITNKKHSGHALDFCHPGISSLIFKLATNIKHQPTSGMYMYAMAVVDRISDSIILCPFLRHWLVGQGHLVGKDFRQ